MRAKLPLLLFLCFFAATAFGEPLAPHEVKELVGRIREKRAGAPQVRADFQEEKTIKMMNKPVTSSGQVWFQTPNKFRREVKGNSPSITIGDGKQVWIYYPKFQSAEHYSLGKRSPLDAAISTITASLNLEGVEQSYNMAGSKEGSTYTLQLTPRAGSIKKMLQQITIRFNEGLQVTRTGMLQANGDRIVTTYSNETRAPIDPGTFAFTPPAGTKITEPLGR